LISGGSLPPFAASFTITCLCSQIFMVAESLLYRLAFIHTGLTRARPFTRVSFYGGTTRGR
jgi:hypothetical protein